MKKIDDYAGKIDNYARKIENSWSTHFRTKGVTQLELLQSEDIESDKVWAGFECYNDINKK